MSGAAVEVSDAARVAQYVTLRALGVLMSRFQRRPRQGRQSVLATCKLCTLRRWFDEPLTAADKRGLVEHVEHAHPRTFAVHCGGGE